MEKAFQESSRVVAGRPEAVAAVEKLYDDVQRSIESRRPVCAVSGRCCRFEEFGHRLFVTTLEMGAFLARVGPTDLMRTWDGTGCPFQINKLCSVHASRPFGCRMFFCDATATQWQNEQYEIYHKRLKELHERLQVPYFYVEWRQALRAVLGEEAQADEKAGRL